MSGYLTLDSIPGGRICRPLFIPDDPMWLALFGGALTELQKAWNYEKFGTLTPEEMATECEAIINQWYADICASCQQPGGQPIVQLGELGQWRMLDGDTWVEPFGEYAVPPLPAIDAPTDEQKRCRAALNAEYVLKQTYEQWTDAWGENLAIADAISTVAEWLATRVGVWLGLLSGAQGIFLFFLLEVFYEAMEFITMDLWTEEFSDKLKCLLLYHAGNVGDTVVFDFQALREDLVLQTNWFDPTFSDIRLMGQVQYMLQFIGSEGLNHAGATTEIESDDCDFCNDEWCYEFTSFGDWTSILGTPGTWYYYMGITLPNDGSYILTSMLAEWDWNQVGEGGDSGLSANSSFSLSPGTSIGAVTPLPIPTNLGITDFSTTSTQFVLGANGFNSGAALTPCRVTFRGTGTCPFGEPNCE